ncbi:MAG: hypothetical protein Q9M94_02750 [Candidatus Gracilibacteria bacterium]|nr:hypothetical protein [Candidatus Gracilibacteria bacterium]MDQ7023845.1 hypothetical protein [Candidatus Gracilibacteria bacterium]
MRRGDKYKGNKFSWCAAIINWCLVKARVETIQQALVREKADFNGYEDKNVNIRAAAIANYRGKAHVAIKVGEDKYGNALYLGGNQSKGTDKRRNDKKGRNRGEVTLRKDKYAKGIVGYREILDNGTLSSFVKEKESKKIPIGSIVVFRRGKAKNH